MPATSTQLFIKRKKWVDNALHMFETEPIVLFYIVDSKLFSHFIDLCAFEVLHELADVPHTFCDY